MQLSSAQSPDRLSAFLEAASRLVDESAQGVDVLARPVQVHAHRYLRPVLHASERRLPLALRKSLAEMRRVLILPAADVGNWPPVRCPQELLDVLRIGEIPDLNVRVGLGGQDVSCVPLEVAGLRDLLGAFPLLAAVLVDASDDQVGPLDRALPDVGEKLPEACDRGAAAAHWHRISFVESDLLFSRDPSEERRNEVHMGPVFEDVLDIHYRKSPRLILAESEDAGV